MEEESRLIKLMANFPACDLREVYFKRWKEIFSEAVEFEEEVQALRAWKEKARPFLEDKLEYLHKKLNENSTSNSGVIMSYESKAKTLTELLGD